MKSRVFYNMRANVILIRTTVGLVYIFMTPPESEVVLENGKCQSLHRDTSAHIRKDCGMQIAASDLAKNGVDRRGGQYGLPNMPDTNSAC